MYRAAVLAAVLLASATGVASAQTAACPPPSGILICDTHSVTENAAYPSGIIRDDAGNLYFGSVGVTFRSGVWKLTPPASAGGSWTMTTLKTFKSNSFGGGVVALIGAPDGSIYGTRRDTSGTKHQCASGPCGVIFKLEQDGAGTWTTTTVHHFHGKDGEGVIGFLSLDTWGNLYGVTQSGGKGACPGGCGTIWAVDTNTQEFRVVHKFTGGRDGGNPIAGVVADGNGNLYGTSQHGTGDADLVYKVTPSGKLHVLFRMQSGVSFSPGELLLGLDGLLYGVTRDGGGQHRGTVFSLDPASGQYTLLHQGGNGGRAGKRPTGRLQRDDQTGALYGLTIGDFGYGTIFKLDDGVWTTLADAQRPYDSLRAPDGTLYGTADGSVLGANGVFAIHPAQ